MSKQTATHRSVHFHVEVGLLQLEAAAVVLNFGVCKIYVMQDKKMQEGRTLL